MLPDVDALGFRLGVEYGSLFGHRGFTHSILFAGMLAMVAVAPVWNQTRLGGLLQSLACVFVATASHGILDAFTDGGMGVAFLAPFDQTRYFFPMTPIQVSPLSVAAFLTQRGVSVLASEIGWVWVPAVLVTVAARWARRRNRAHIC
jgi:inner membrane protein